MANFNRVILAGNLTRDPQLKYLPSNTAVCEFGMAINHKWRDKDGNQKEDVCFVDVAAFGRQGEVINQYMAKGRSLLIEGRLKLDQWTAQDGSKRSKHTVVVENFTFLGGPRDGGGGAPRDPEGATPQREERPRREYGPPRDAQAQPQPQSRGGYDRAAQAPPQEPTYDDRPPAGDDIPF